MPELKKQRKSKHVLRTPIQVLKRKKGILREYGPDNKHGEFTVLVNDKEYTTAGKVQECMSEYAKQWIVQLEKDVARFNTEGNSVATVVEDVLTLIRSYQDEA